METHGGYERIGGWQINLNLPDADRARLKQEMVDPRLIPGALGLCYVEHCLMGSSTKLPTDPWKSERLGEDVRERVAANIEDILTGKKPWGFYCTMHFYDEEKMPQHMREGFIVRRSYHGIIEKFDFRNGGAWMEPLLMVEGKPDEEQIKTARFYNNVSLESASKKPRFFRTAYDWVSLGEAVPHSLMLTLPTESITEALDTFYSSYKGYAKESFRTPTEEEMKQLTETWLSLAKDVAMQDEGFNLLVSDFDHTSQDKWLGKSIDERVRIMISKVSWVSAMGLLEEFFMTGTIPRKRCLKE